MSTTHEVKMLELAENITKSCSFSSIKTEKGRGECQHICQRHSCCFSDDENSNYGCSNDPDMMCSVYVGCKSLFNPGDDGRYNSEMSSTNEYAGKLSSETIYSEGAGTNQIVEGDLQHVGSGVLENSSEETSSHDSSEAELVSRVISTVCAKNNLQTYREVHECVDLCSSSICCFDSREIFELNPHIDTILKLEGATDNMLDLTTMGTCTEEDTNTSYCRAHSGCKNLLLIGSSKIRQSLPSNPVKNENFFKTNDRFGSSNSNDLQVTGHVLTFYVIVISLAAYMLIYKRLPSLESSETTEIASLVETNSCGSNSHEMI